MSDSHLRRLHELNREYPAVEPSTLFRDYHYQCIDEIEPEDTTPQLQFHIFPADSHDDTAHRYHCNR